MLFADYSDSIGQLTCEILETYLSYGVVPIAAPRFLTYNLLLQVPELQIRQSLASLSTLLGFS